MQDWVSTGVPTQPAGEALITVLVCCPFIHSPQAEYTYVHTAGGGAASP